MSIYLIDRMRYIYINTIGLRTEYIFANTSIIYKIQLTYNQTHYTKCMKKIEKSLKACENKTQERGRL